MNRMTSTLVSQKYSLVFRISSQIFNVNWSYLFARSIKICTCNVFQIYLINLACLLSIGNAARILGIFPVAAKSHTSCNHAIMRSLHAAGHHVTMISPFPSEVKIQNFTFAIRYIHLYQSKFSTRFPWNRDAQIDGFPTNDRYSVLLRCNKLEGDSGIKFIRQKTEHKTFRAVLRSTHFVQEKNHDQ